MRRTDFVRKSGATLLGTALLASLFTVLSPQAQALPIVSGVVGGFENDGNQDDGAVGVPIDWQTVKSDPLITEWALIHDDNDEDTNDSSQIDSAKEQDPTSWACSTNEAPPKDDIYRLYLASQITSADQLLHMAYVRATGTGDTDINVEFNQVSSEFSCPGDPGRVRSADDLLISFTFGGGSDPSVSRSSAGTRPPNPAIPATRTRASPATTSSLPTATGTSSRFL